MSFILDLNMLPSHTNPALFLFFFMLLLAYFKSKSYYFFFFCNKKSDPPLFKSPTLVLLAVIPKMVLDRVGYRKKHQGLLLFLLLDKD